MKRKRGIVILVERRAADEESMQDFIRYWAGNDKHRGRGHMEACYKRMLQAGLEPLEPGERRRVRVTVTRL